MSTIDEAILEAHRWVTERDKIGRLVAEFCLDSDDPGRNLGYILLEATRIMKSES